MITTTIVCVKKFNNTPSEAALEICKLSERLLTFSVIDEQIREKSISLRKYDYLTNRP
jgi:hypothetical protein